MFTCFSSVTEGVFMASGLGVYSFADLCPSVEDRITAHDALQLAAGGGSAHPPFDRAARGSPSAPRVAGPFGAKRRGGPEAPCVSWSRRAWSSAAMAVTWPTRRRLSAWRTPLRGPPPRRRERAAALAPAGRSVRARKGV